LGKEANQFTVSLLKGQRVRLVIQGNPRGRDAQERPLGGANSRAAWYP
jgi:hypothetical protein